MFERNRTELHWEENEEPDHGETKSLIGRLTDIYGHTETFLSDLLEEFTPTRLEQHLQVAQEIEVDGQGGKADDESGSTAGKSKSLRPCDQIAFSQYQRAVEQEQSIKTDDEAYDWVADDMKADGIQLTRRDNWKRYVRSARKFHGEQKNGPRIGNETRSVVSVMRGV